MLFRNILAALLCLFISGALLAQGTEDESGAHDSGKLGGAIGYAPGLVYINMDPINSMLQSASLPTISSQPIFTSGIAGYAYILVVPNLRVGGVGASGGLKSLSEPGNTSREVDLNVSYGGVSIDYVVPFTARLDLSVGTVLGKGGVDLTLRRDNGSDKGWTTIWGDFGSTTPVQSYSTTMSGSFVLYQPNVTLEYTVLRWLGVRAGVGYSGTLGGSWTQDGTYDVAGVPSSLSGKGFMITGGIYLGTFIF
jgi:hypothetical protein